MSEELQPVRCGCGGEVEILHSYKKYAFVYCKQCETMTTDFPTEDEAIEAWNRAMSGNVQDCAKDARCSDWSDLISRRDALDAVNDCGICIQRILDIPSAEPERKWIPVTEALPNNEEYDWVLGQIRETDSGYLWIPRQVEYREIKDDWYEDSIGWLKKNPDHAFEVIAWMPLPEPWRGE